MMQTPSRPKVLVVGAGFAGLAAVSALAGSSADVTVIDQNIYSTFQPLLYQVATGGLNPGDVSYPIRSLARKRRVRFRRGHVSSIEACMDGTWAKVSEEISQTIPDCGRSTRTRMTSNFWSPMFRGPMRS